ncbi:MAG: GNAT family N-acetyltransferase [Leptolyngbyaceae cyanobacterium MO_188.B28]|nr:GNAT family N-acetyltransferase [Leptolyngbyaceae cyanobacterium MO_188.B28]
MSKIVKSESSHADRLFEIHVSATNYACAAFYPAEIVEIWHKGRTAQGMAMEIADGNFYTLIDESEIRGFIDYSHEQLRGLFVDPEHHGCGYGSALLQFAMERIEIRPAFLKSTLNAVSFYLAHGWTKGATELVRRHDRDIYVVHMNLV